MRYVSARYVHSIRGLLIPVDANCDKIAKQAEDYVETAPSLIEKIKDCLEYKDNSTLEAYLTRIITMLHGMNARRLKTECEGIVAFARVGNLEICEKKLAPFIANLLALSIEIQTAKYYSTSKAGSTIDDHSVEFFTDILQSLKFAQELIEDSDYDNALDVITGMSVLDGDTSVGMLISALKTKEKPLELILGVIGRYEEKITQKLKAQADAHWKIMLVDDRPEILTMVGGYLRGLYKVFALTGGEVALKFLEKDKPDLFILDIDMPDMDGITLAGKIRSLPDHGKTPIVFLTSHAQKEYVVKALQAGANDFVVKPAGRDMLLAKISKQLS